MRGLCACVFVSMDCSPALEVASALAVTICKKNKKQKKKTRGKTLLLISYMSTHIFFLPSPHHPTQSPTCYLIYRSCFSNTSGTIKNLHFWLFMIITDGRLKERQKDPCRIGLISVNLCYSLLISYPRTIFSLALFYQ